MKITGLLIFLLAMQLSARTMAQKVSITKENSELKSVLKELHKRTGYLFIFNNAVMLKAKPVTINVVNTELSQVLIQIFKDQPLTYELDDNTIIIKERTAPKQQDKSEEEQPAAPKKITGKVTDSKGTPIPGVTVMIKGSQAAVSTLVDGSYTINANKGDILQFRFLGFETKEVLVEDQTSLNVTLTEVSKGLSEVVVIGYGNATRATLSSAVSTVSNKDLNKGAITDVGQLLQGKVPGLNITASGDPNKPAAVVLRGASTINSSQGPFYVVDGVPGVDIATIAPDDIATIDVLKDAAATAIYGNRAANGVIMVTTKKGKKGQLAIAYNGYVGAEKVANQLDMMNADELRSFLKTNNQAPSSADDKGANTDWQKAIERNTAISHNHNLSFSGGTEHSSYYASVNYVKKDGIIANTGLERVIGRLALTQSAFDDKLKFNLSVTNSNSDANDVPYRNVILLQSALFLPFSPIKNADGSYFENPTTQNYYNPVAMLNNSVSDTKYNNLVAAFNTQLKLPFGLTYNLNLSYLKTNTLHGEFYTSYFTSHYNGLYDNPDPGLGYHNQQTFGSNGQATRSSLQTVNKILETYFNWDKKIGNHSINAVLGYSWQNNTIGDGFQVTTSNFPVDNVSYNNLALSNPYAVSGFQVNFGPDGVFQETRLISDFARLNYNYNEKYLLQGSIRRDGSSVFGKEHQWGYFPSVGAAWRISQEGFMKESSTVNDLKLRASYGITGNSSGFNAYTAQAISGTLGTFYSNGNYINALGATQAANVNLQWEKTSTANLGLDFELFKGKVSGAIEVYNKKTTGMIFSYAVDPILVPTGSIVANGGSMTNKGIEVSINTTPVRTPNFRWSTSINLAHNKNVINSLSNPLFSGGDSVLYSFPEGAGQSSHSLQILKSGKPLGQFFSLQYAGKNADGVSQFVGADGKLTTSPTIGTDYHYLGSAQPKLLVGWSNDFHYKNFDLNIFFRGVFGNKIFDATRADLFRPNTAQYTNILKDAAGESAADYNAYLYSSRFVESGSYLRLDNATLAYNFKLNSKYIKLFRIYTSANNVFIITKYKGVDPEINQGGISPGVDYNNFYPKTRTLLIGANVTF
ncbi:TonB-dependent receptor [Mucilaginibacter celer]|nr:TonB-dependent receptor [Mucilaginibacter celer]